MATDTSEKGLETLIMRHLTGVDGIGVASFSQGVTDEGPSSDGSGYFAGSPGDFDRGFVIDTAQLFLFLQTTQPDVFARLNIGDVNDKADFKRREFLTRLSNEIGNRGVIDVLRKGISHGPSHFTLFFGTPSEGNQRATELNAKNRFSITRQLGYSNDATRNSLDLGLFINGLPIATFELKNSLTRQTVRDAIEQYKNDRDPREPIFAFGRCAVHFAVDDAEVYMCTELKGKGSWFLPFNKGYKDGAGNPPNPNGLKTDYLWKEILEPKSLTNIIENYSQITEEKDLKTGRKKKVQIWPRYHQLDVVRRILSHVREKGVGHRYLLQHSAGSGKSNSIAWLAHQLIGVRKEGSEVFDSVIVVTDRRILDDQIQKTIKSFMQVGSTVGHAERSEDLRKMIQDGKKIIVSTVQKFPFILDAMSLETSRSFAIVIDEAHSSQGGRTSAAMNQALSGNGGGESDDDGPDPEDTVNKALEELIAKRRLMSNASYFAFTATPKNRTLEMFGEALPADAEGKVKHIPFHSYTMKQAIEEGFIIDVLKSYTPIESYYHLVKKIEDDPEFDIKKAKKKLRRYVQGHAQAIDKKAEVMVEHFHGQVIGGRKIAGNARAMVVTNGIQRAIEYFMAIRRHLEEIKSPYKAIVAFSGEVDYAGRKVTEASLNGFPSNEIAAKIKEDPYRILVCADKFQTGYDEPLLHTMYVDKPLSGIKAVQTLSRLNRAAPKKYDCFVLDFQNNIDAIQEAFQDYYKTTLLAEETDPNKLHDLKMSLDGAQVYSDEDVEMLVKRFLAGGERDQLDVILDRCVDVYSTSLDEDQQVDFKGKAKAFCRAYAFLSSILPYSFVNWEKLSIFLNLLVPKLPAPVEEDLSKGILEAIDMDSYRLEKQGVQKVMLEDEDSEIEPIPTTGGGGKSEPELDRLSSIIKSFNEMYGKDFDDPERVERRIRDEIAPEVARDEGFRNAHENTPHTAREEHKQVLQRVMQRFLGSDMQLYRKFSEDQQFRNDLSNLVYNLAEAELRRSPPHAER